MPNISRPASPNHVASSMLACPPITHGMLGSILEMIGVSLSSVISGYTVTNAPEVEKSKKFPEVTVHSRACRTVAPASIRTAALVAGRLRQDLYQKLYMTTSGCEKFQMIVQSLAVTRHRMTGGSCLGEPTGRSRSIVRRLPSASFSLFLGFCSFSNLPTPDHRIHGSTWYFPFLPVSNIG